MRRPLDSIDVARSEGGCTRCFTLTASGEEELCFAARSDDERELYWLRRWRPHFSRQCLLQWRRHLLLYCRSLAPMDASKAVLMLLLATRLARKEESTLVLIVHVEASV
jgi:hypothetical protein